MNEQNFMKFMWTVQIDSKLTKNMTRIRFNSSNKKLAKLASIKLHFLIYWKRASILLGPRYAMNSIINAKTMPRLGIKSITAFRYWETSPQHEPWLKVCKFYYIEQGVGRVGHRCALRDRRNFMAIILTSLRATVAIVIRFQSYNTCLPRTFNTC